MCVCVNKLRREGATGVGFPTEKLEQSAAVAGRTRASLQESALSGPGKEFEIRNSIPGTVLGAEGEARVKGQEQRMHVEGASVWVWNGFSSLRES